MKNKLNQNQQAEALRIKEWCMTIISFISGKTDNNKQQYEIYEEPFSDYFGPLAPYTGFWK